jgi:hypothetical protein
MTNDGQFDTRSPEDIIRERTDREELENIRRFQQATVDAAAKLDKEYRDLRTEIIAILRVLPDRLRRNDYRRGEIQEVFVSKTIHQKRRFLRKPALYASIETKQQALWYAGYIGRRLYVTTDATFIELTDIFDGNGNWLRGKAGRRFDAFVPVTLESVLPETRQVKSLDEYVMMLQNLKRAASMDLRKPFNG